MHRRRYLTATLSLATLAVASPAATAQEDDLADPVQFEGTSPDVTDEIDLLGLRPAAPTRSAGRSRSTAHRRPLFTRAVIAGLQLQPEQ